MIDPGIWGEDSELEGADAVLLTHEHSDHVNLGLVRELSCPVLAPAGATLPGLDFEPVVPGQRLTVAGFDVEAFGGTHAPVLADQEVCPNVGYLVQGVYHPGDSLAPPDRLVDTVLVPMQGSWLKTEEAVGFLRTVNARQAFGVHDGQVNHRAIAALSHWFEVGSRGRYSYLPPGTAASVGDRY